VPDSHNAVNDEMNKSEDLFELIYELILIMK